MINGDNDACKVCGSNICDIRHDNTSYNTFFGCTYDDGVSCACDESVYNGVCAANENVSNEQCGKRTWYVPYGSVNICANVSSYLGDISSCNIPFYNDASSFLVDIAYDYNEVSCIPDNIFRDNFLYVRTWSFCDVFAYVCELQHTDVDDNTNRFCEHQSELLRW